MNGTFGFGRSDGPFDAGNPFTYPDLLTIRVGGESRFYEVAHYVTGFVQDKWRLNNRLTLTLGLRYDLEIIPIPETDDPITGEGNYPVDTNNCQPRLGFSYDLGGRGRDLIRGGYGRFFEKTHFELIGGLFTGTPFTSSFTRTFPLTGADPNPRQGLMPTDPMLVNGPTLNRALLDTLFVPGTLLRNTGASWDNPDRRVPKTDQLTIGYQRQLGPRALGQRRLRPRQEQRHADVAAAEPDAARDHGGDVAEHPPEQRHPRPGHRGAPREVRAQLRGVHRRCHDAAQRRANRLRRADAAVRQAVQQQLQRARVLHARPFARQHQRRTAWRRAASRSSTTCTWS